MRNRERADEVSSPFYTFQSINGRIVLQRICQSSLVLSNTGLPTRFELFADA